MNNAEYAEAVSKDCDFVRAKFDQAKARLAQAEKDVKYWTKQLDAIVSVTFRVTFHENTPFKDEGEESK